MTGCETGWPYKSVQVTGMRQQHSYCRADFESQVNLHAQGIEC